MAILNTGIVAPTGGYQIERSLRFNSADSAYLNRTPASAGNRKTWTWSGWCKRSKISDSAIQTIWGTPSNTDLIGFDTDDVFRVWFGTNTYNIETTQVFRDVSAWGHWLVSVDTTQATSSNRVKIYYNGAQVTAFSTASYPTQNYDTGTNNTVEHRIGKMPSGDYNYLDGYLTEINFIDGQALTPSDFGETDSATGVWKPKKFSGTYGTNGFFLKFADNSGTTSTTLGKDSSGNGNNWTPNNFSVTAGVDNDSLVDTPTSYGTDTGVGGEVRGNYAVFNPLAVTSVAATFAEGNLKVTTGGAGGNGYGTMAIPASGKWYWEVTFSSGSDPMIGISAYLSTQTYAWQNGNSVLYYSNGQKYVDGTGTSYGASYTTNDVIGVAVDADAGTITFYKNNTSQGSITHAVADLFPCLADGASGTTATFYSNFGQRAFAYTAPSGFKALCTQNLPTPTIGATSTTQANDYFNPVLYTGNGGTAQNITGVGFQPDWVWIKSRNSASFSHRLYDAVRGAGKEIYSNDTAAESNVAQSLTAFISDGFSLGTDLNNNQTSTTYVAWNWKANGAGSSNTDGSITSTVSANTTSGFSIVTYTGTGTAATVGHGLGVAPSIIIVKVRANGGANTAWHVYSSVLGNGSYLSLNTTAASDTGSIWNNTSPTSTVFSIGSSAWPQVNNNTGTYVAYCFASVAGYSAFGSYTGNGSADGPFIFTGFRPRYIMLKASSRIEAWYIFDTARNTYNVADNRLYANTSGAEGTGGSYGPDILSNGFKLRTSDSGFNNNGDTYVYAAFAESPFKYALAR